MRWWRRRRRVTVTAMTAIAVVFAVLMIGTVTHFLARRGDHRAPPLPVVALPANDAAPVIDDPVPDDAVWVARGGSDVGAGQRGRRDAPLATVTAAVARAGPGGTVVIGGGVWHESVVIDSTPGLTLRSAPGERVWFDGTDELEGFTRDGESWQVRFEHRLDASPTYTRGAPDNDRPGWRFLDPTRPLAADPHQVWHDSAPLRQVGSQAELGPDTFYVDDARGLLFVGSDPGGHEMRAGIRPRALTIQSSGVTVRGIGVRGYVPSVPDFGAVTVEAPDARLADILVAASSTTGLSVSSPGATLERVHLYGSGMLGLHMDRADGSVLKDIRAERNNTQGFNQAPVAGGAKITRTRGLRIDGGTYADNAGTGLWLDESVVDASIARLDALRNTGHGLHVEISTGVVVVGVRSLGNLLDGLQVQNANHVQVWDSTFAGNKRGVNFVQDDRRPTGPDVPGVDDREGAPASLTWETGQSRIVNCVISSGSRRGEALFAVEDFGQELAAGALDITLQNNLYVRTGPNAPRWTHVWTRPSDDPEVFDDLAAFTTGTGQDTGSVEVHREGASTLATIDTLLGGPSATAPPAEIKLPGPIADIAGSRYPGLGAQR